MGGPGTGWSDRCDSCKSYHRRGETCGQACARESKERLEDLRKDYPDGNVPAWKLDWALAPLRW